MFFVATAERDSLLMTFSENSDYNPESVRPANEHRLIYECASHEALKHLYHHLAEELFKHGVR
jgi:hypothetical protein